MATRCYQSLFFMKNPSISMLRFWFSCFWWVLIVRSSVLMNLSMCNKYITRVMTELSRLAVTPELCSKLAGGESQEKASRTKGWGHAKLLFLQKQLDTVCWIGSNDIKSDIHFQERLAFPCCRSFISRWDKPDKIKALTLGTPNKCKATMKKRTILKHVGWCRSIDVRS